MLALGCQPRWTCRRVCTRRPRSRRRRPPASIPRSWRDCAGDRSGPARGGRSQAVAGSASRPLEYYFGATGGGLWKTTDGGLTWRAVSDRFFKSSSVGAVAVSESNPDVVYVGMGETELRGNVLQGDGVYKSVDARQDLDARRAREDADRLAHPRSIRPIPTSPTSPRSATPTAPTRIAASSRPPTAARPGRRCCSATTRPAPSISTMDAKNPEVLYAGLWEVFRTPHSLSSGGPGSGLFKTTDGGQTLDRDHPQPRTAEAALGQGRAWRSRRRDAQPRLRDHRGGRRRRVPLGRRRRDLDAGQRRPPAAPARVLLHAASMPTRRRRTRSTSSTPACTARPTPASRSAPIRVPHGDNHDLWIAANDPKRMINANDGSANVSTNGGETWTARTSRRRSSTTSSRRRTCRITSAARSRTTAPRACPSTGSGELYEVGGGESGYIAPDPQDSRRVLRRQLRRSADPDQRPHRRAPRDQRLARQPDGFLVRRHHRALPVDLSDRDRADRTPTSSTSPRSTCGSRPTRARAGRGSAPI